MSSVVSSGEVVQQVQVQASVSALEAYYDDQVKETAAAKRLVSIDPGAARAKLSHVRCGYMPSAPIATKDGRRALVVYGFTNARRVYLLTETSNRQGEVFISACCTDCKYYTVMPTVAEAIQQLSVIDACNRAKSCNCVEHAKHSAVPDKISGPAVKARVAAASADKLDELISHRSIGMMTRAGTYIADKDPKHIPYILAFDYERELCYNRRDEGVRIVKTEAGKSLALWGATHLYSFATYTSDDGAQVVFASCQSCSLSQSGETLADACQALAQSHPQCAKAPTEQ
jgi:hypothetical protein